MGMLLACSQGMGPLMGSFQAYCLIVALVASRPQHLSLKTARQGACGSVFLVATRRILSTLRRIFVLHSDARPGVADHPV